MFKNLIPLVLILLCQLRTSATVHRVNNNAAINAAFSQIDVAINAAATGDTIYIEGSASSYPAITLTKKLTLVGPGYFLNETNGNPNTQVNPNTATLSSITFSAGSKYSVVEGLDLYGLNVNDSFITVQRCKLGSALSFGPGRNTYGDTLRNNYITGALYGGNYPCSSLLIYNNIFTSYSIFSFANQANVNGYFVNNSFTYSGSFSIACANFVFQNNIFAGGISGAGISANSFFNNVLAGTGISATYGNINSVNPNDLFVNTESTDGKCLLKPASPARNAGIMNGNAVDCGAFGGPAPYILSGMPAIPSIYQLNVPLQVPSGTAVINITMSAAAH